MQAWQAALSTWLAFLAADLLPAVDTDTATAAFLAAALLPAVDTDSATAAFLAAAPPPAVQADSATAAILARAPLPAVRTDLTSVAFLATVRLPVVLATAATVFGHLALGRCCDRCLLLCNELLGPVRLEVLGIQCRIFFVRRFELPRPAGHTRAVTTR